MCYIESRIYVVITSAINIHKVKKCLVLSSEPLVISSDYFWINWFILNYAVAAIPAILDYLNMQNRPYSAVDIMNNLHKEYGKVVTYVQCYWW